MKRDYKSKYMNDYHDTIEPKYFDIQCEVRLVSSYLVEAVDMVDAIQQLEYGNDDCVIAEYPTQIDTKRGRIISVTVNNDE